MEELAASDTPLVAVIEHDVTRAGDVVAFIALASTMNTALLALTAASRNMWGMARSGSLPRIIASVGPRGHAPVVAACIGFVVATAFALVGDLALVASVTDFAVYVIFIAVNAALVVLRLRAPEAPRTFRVPLAIGRVPLPPIAGTIAVLVMLAYLQPAAWLLGLAGILAGIMWASLHAPVWALAGQSLDWCMWQWLYVVALRVLMTWIYNNTGRSLFAMDLLHPGLFVWWYLWPVSGAGLSVPTLYDPRNLALIAVALGATVTYLWGPKTLARYRYA